MRLVLIGCEVIQREDFLLVQSGQRIAAGGDEGIVRADEVS